MPSAHSSGLLVGIDLGTTHTAVAVATSAVAVPTIMPIAQWVAHGQTAALPLLPSVLFAEPGHTPNEALSWDEAPWLIGAYAQRRARELPARGVVSAKSWLCNDAVDREAMILPWTRQTAGEAEPDTSLRMSPVAASTRVLRHVFHQLQAAYPDALPGARVVLAIPASFDQAARQLTLKAAKAAGFDVELVEEPQAAFQDVCLNLGPKGIEDFLGSSASKLILVVDVGGGTTDLALMRITRESSGVRAERVAVGRHLLLGGDNVDLALAHIVEQRFKSSGASNLSALEFAGLLLSVREAKERLLGEPAEESFPIVLAAAGSALVGATRRTALTRHEVENLLREGFLPEVGDLSEPATRTGLLGFGLPFERDPAITRHVARFVARHTQELGAPHAVLFNGGLFRSKLAARRLVEVLEHILGRTLEVIDNPHPDLAVARGAVAYAQSTLGHGLAVQSRSAHGYYVAVAGGEAPGALCVVPRGAPEHVVFDTAQHVGLSLGRTSRFELYASDTRRDQAGTWVTLNRDDFQRLPRLTATLAGASAASAAAPEVVPVQLTGQLSAVGTLHVAAVELAAPHRQHQLAFELRTDSEIRAEPTKESPKVNSSLTQALERIDRVFGKRREDVGEREAKDLVRELERLLGPRPSWELPTLRALADALLVDVRARKRSADHERVFYLLAGFCLRPGFGHALDAARLERFAPLFSEGLSFSQERKHWEAFLIAWRRVAPGLTESRQSALRDLLDPAIAPSERKLKKPKNFRPQGDEDILSLCTWLERVSAERRGELGTWLLERTWTSRNPAYWDWIGRVGARVPLYASVHHVVVPRLAERWLEHLLSENWQTLPNAARSAVALARFTDDRERDLSLGARQAVALRLRQTQATSETVNCVLEYVPLAANERSESYGNDLPAGFSLL